MFKKKIYIPFHIERPVGGPGTFMRNLKIEMDGMRFRYLNKPMKHPSFDCGGIFFLSHFIKHFLKTLKGKTKK